ncbi:PadR family transcriptional regulator [Catellatospora coxensis]
MSTTRMMILGVVRMAQPVHGYDVRRELLSWHADKWANVQPGSVYHALKKLAEEGALREVGSEQVGGRPARTRYEMTPKGMSSSVTCCRRRCGSSGRWRTRSWRGSR